MRLIQTIVIVLISTVCLATIILVIFLSNNNTFQPKNKSWSPRLQLLDLPQFTYILNSNACSEQHHVLMIVTSYARNLATRRSIRNAYPNQVLNKMGVKRVFLLAALDTASQARSTEEIVTQSDVQIESDKYSDLVQGNFYEAYRNLTYKHVMGLQWGVGNCPDARFIVKMDDDIVVDLYQLLDLLKHSSNLDQDQLLMGYVLRRLTPMRDPSNKWFVTRKEYSKSIYPPFLSGWLYVTTPSIAEKLVLQSRHVPYFWIDDTYVTGILAKLSGIKHLDISNKFSVHPEFIECCFKDKNSSRYMCDFIAGPSGGDKKLMGRFQQHALKCHLTKCKRRAENKMLQRTCVTNGKLLDLGRGKAKIMPYNLF